LTNSIVDSPANSIGGIASPRPAIGMAQWFTERARRAGSRPALTFEGHTWTYAGLLEDVDRLAACLEADGVQPGMRVAYLGLNHPMFLVTMFATAKAGAIFVPLNFRLTGSELSYMINDAGVHTLVVGQEHLAVIDPVREELCCRRFYSADGGPAEATRWPRLSEAIAGGRQLQRQAAAPLNDDVAVIMYTSGTTGRPKGAMLTHGNFWWNHVAELYTLDICADDVLLVCAPIFHIGGLNVLLMTTLLKGGHVVMHRSFDAARVLTDIAAYRVRTLFAVPAMLLFISQQPAFATASLESLRLIMCGGAPCPESLLHTYNGRGIAIQQGYGLTETAAMVSGLTNEYAIAKLGSVGQTTLLTQIRLVDSQGHEVRDPGARGEICVRGPNVTRGYWNNEQGTRAAFDDEGFFHTGDVGYFDEEGFYYVCDRVKDMIISGGENVYPAEVESVLYEHPAVAEVAVIGTPDERWGETVTAVVTLKAGQSLTLEELQGFAAQRLARYKIPRLMRVVPALPRNATGKLLKYKLREVNSQS
jgi:fatty-acyl-CoA synthase